MTKEELKAYRESLGLTQEPFAKRVGVRRNRTVSDWEVGAKPIPNWLISRIEYEKQHS